MLNFDWLAGISLESAKMIFLVLFVLIGVLILFIPNDYIFQGVEKKNRRWWNNLKLWAIGVLALLFLTYYIF
ncbi:MAG: hypothetical protein IMF01_04155 [Proteobacteria bacterium]|nr:hypothetical protein [Pseudomonadota bacterium]